MRPVGTILSHQAYINASLAESKPSHNINGFQTKECKSLDILKSNIHILGLKKQCAQVEVDMLSEAIAHMSEFEHTDDGRHAAIPLFSTLTSL
jgi:hypothetical protein